MSRKNLRSRDSYRVLLRAYYFAGQWTADVTDVAGKPAIARAAIAAELVGYIIRSCNLPRRKPS